MSTRTPRKRPPSPYAAILRTKEAYLFDLGTLLMRLYMPMLTLGSVAMLTLMGYSALFSGSVSSVVAASLFLISPRVSKLVDERGQSAVVPWAASISFAGVAAMIAVVQLGLPSWLCYVAGFLMGFGPSPQALARARWLFLIETGRLGDKPPAVRTVFSYEGVIDDIAFMFGPTMCIAIAAALFPTAGLLVGGAIYVAGVVMLLASKNTEPSEQWIAQNRQAAAAVREKSAIVCYPSIRALFALMLFMGATFGVFDTITVVLTEDLGHPEAASVCMMAASAVSIVSGLVFGGMHFKMGPARLLLATAILFALGYGTMMLIDSIPALLAVSVVGGVTYAPFFISATNMCERAVPKHRITESLSWVSAGFSCGLALGPTLAGFISDTFGPLVGFDAGAVFSLAIIPLALATQRVVRKGDRPQ